MTLTSDIAWHQRQLADCLDTIARVEAEPDNDGELAVLRAHAERLRQAIRDLEALQALSAAVKNAPLV